VTARRGSALRAIASAVTLALLVALAHGGAFHAEFIAWDDPQYVTANRQVQAHDPRAWLEILDPRTLVMLEWTPLVTATHRVERHVLGTDPAIYHATNLVLQFGCAVAVLALFGALGLPWPLALGAASWFAVHPLQVESVAWVAARKNLLSTLFFLLAAWAYLGARSPRRQLNAFGLFLLSIASKATAVVLPAWLAGLHVLRRDRPVSRWGLALLPFFAVGLARGLYSVATQADTVESAAALGLSGRLAIMGPVLLRYARQAAWPSDLALLYPWPALGWTEPQVAGAWAAVCALIAATVVLGRKDRRLLEVAWLVPVALFPVLNLLPAPYFQADRYTHLALVGVAGILALCLERVVVGHSRLAGALLLGWALALVPISRARTEVWLDSKRLWTDALAHDPSFARGHSNLGLVLLSEGQIGTAAHHLQRAVELEPEQALWRVNLAAVRVSNSELEEGRRLLEQAVRENANLPEAYGTLAVIALRENRAEEALAYAERAVSFRGGDPLLDVHVPEALAALGRREEALARYEAIAQIYPISQVLLGWADLEHRAGRPERAEALYRRLLRDEPQNEDATYNLATLRLNVGDNSAALKLYDQLLVYHPNHAAAHNNRGSALLALGRVAEARESYARAIRLAPYDPRFKTNLANVLGSFGQCAEALPLYEEVLAVEPDSTLARLNRASCLVQVGRGEEAVPILRTLRSEGAYPDRVERLLAEAEAGPRE
jgi:tetratricopeptide (TPR) repeat protein